MAKLAADTETLTTGNAVAGKWGSTWDVSRPFRHLVDRRTDSLTPLHSQATKFPQDDELMTWSMTNILLTRQFYAENPTLIPNGPGGTGGSALAPAAGSDSAGASSVLAGASAALATASPASPAATDAAAASAPTTQAAASGSGSFAEQRQAWALGALGVMATLALV